MKIIKAKSKILVLGLALITLTGLLSPATKARAEKGICTITDTTTTPPTVLTRENSESENCVGTGMSFNPYSPSNQKPESSSSTTSPCTGIDDTTGDPTPSGCLGWEGNLTPTTTTSTPGAPADLKYTLLAPLPCNTPGVEGCDDNRLLTAFDPTGKGGEALGGYLNLMISIFIGISAVLAVIMIVWGGIEYMTTELISSKEAGKQRITNAIFGLVLALGAWTILNQINPDLLDVSLKSLENVTVNVELETLSDGTYSSSGGGGAGGSSADCVVPPDPGNACSPTTLASSCFGGRAEEASKICSVESSGGIPDRESRSDRLNMGTGPSYSIGLWQINLTANEVGGLDCPSAFTGTCGPGTATRSRKDPPVGGPTPGNCSVTIKPEKMQLYNDCVAAAKDIQKNTTAACKVYGNNGSTFKPWQYTANKCGIK